jgi:hypothetical protein
MFETGPLFEHMHLNFAKPQIIKTISKPEELYADSKFVEMSQKNVYGKSYWQTRIGIFGFFTFSFFLPITINESKNLEFSLFDTHTNIDEK